MRERLLRFFSKGTDESSKRLLAGVGVATLATLVLWLGGAVVYQAARQWSVDVQLVIALGGAITGLTTLCGVAYRKPEP